MIGIVGGGQLAKMLAQAAKNHDIEVCIQASSSEDPAVVEASKTIFANPKDSEGTKNLAEHCSCITFENEWVNIEKLNLIKSADTKFLPSLKSLEPLVDKISQRNLLGKLNIPGPLWLPLSEINMDNISLPSNWEFPVMAKSSRDGYDGKGTKVLNSEKDLKDLLFSVDKEAWLLEEWIQYDKELSIIVSRDNDGITRSFPIVETKQYNQVCDWVIAPAKVSHQIEVMAINIAFSILRKLDYIGVLAIEFFYGDNGLLVNEIAPRTHNSAHFSIDACNSSQFDHQISIISGLRVEDPKLLVPGALMINLLGLQVTEGEFLSLDDRLKKIRDCKGSNLHWYGKSEERAGRKMGHVTFLLKESDSGKRRKEAEVLLQRIRSIWPIY
tara:strand:+ start:421 stop:1572 length:1152 start_codon:yes stop_codon:yes gene_type:complete